MALVKAEVVNTYKIGLYTIVHYRIGDVRFSLLVSPELEPLKPDLYVDEEKFYELLSSGDIQRLHGFLMESLYMNSLEAKSLEKLKEQDIEDEDIGEVAL